MTIDEIINTRKNLNYELTQALATMERKNDVIKIREKIKELQEYCPHFSNKYDWAVTDGTCPYCGRKLN